MRKAGVLNKRVIIEIADGTTDDVGQEIIAWRTVLTVWASIVGIQNLRGQERAFAAGVNAWYDSLITVTWSPFISAITAKWRIRHVFHGQTVIYDVKSVPPVPDADGMLVIMCQSGLTSG